MSNGAEPTQPREVSLQAAAANQRPVGSPKTVPEKLAVLQGRLESQLADVKRVREALEANPVLEELLAGLPPGMLRHML